MCSIAHKASKILVSSTFPSNISITGKKTLLFFKYRYMYIIFKTTTKTRDYMIQNVNISTNKKIAVGSVLKRKPKIDMQEI